MRQREPRPLIGSWGTAPEKGIARMNLGHGGNVPRQSASFMALVSIARHTSTRWPSNPMVFFMFLFSDFPEDDIQKK